jgi:NAD(P) transhydrogenase subunit alpha
VNEQLLTELTIFVLAVFVGFEVISKVPTTLHTPLMSATNAIHGIVLVGALLVAGVADPKLGWFLSIIVVILASLNVFGGFTVTERMLQMFKPRATPPSQPGDSKP